MNLIQKIEKENLEKSGKVIPSFRAGDVVKVSVKVIEGTRARTQIFEGIVIGRKNKGINSSFRVRKISYGEGVERVFSLYSPNISIEVARYGDVCRAKLYYLRERTGKSARIREDLGYKLKVMRKEKEENRAEKERLSKELKSV